MVVTSQNTWPSLSFDAKAVNRFVGRFLSPGFYYKTFISPRWLWPTYQRLLERFAPGGRVDPNHEAAKFDHRYVHPDVLIAGGGPTGMAAAVAASDAGASVILVEEEHEIGGHLRYGTDDDLEPLFELRTAILTRPNIEVMTNSVVSGRYDHNWVSIVQRSLDQVEERLVLARAKMLVVAAGTLERPYVFEGNDLPGVMFVDRSSPTNQPLRGAPWPPGRGPRGQRRRRRGCNRPKESRRGGGRDSRRAEG